MVTTKELAAYLREVWSYDGLEVKAISSESVIAVVGPSFPISELCMDVGDPCGYDANVVLKLEDNTATLVITPLLQTRPRRAWLAILLCMVLATVSSYLAIPHLHRYNVTLPSLL